MLKSIINTGKQEKVLGEEMSDREIYLLKALLNLLLYAGAVKTGGELDGLLSKRGGWTLSPKIPVSLG